MWPRLRLTWEEGWVHSTVKDLAMPLIVPKAGLYKGGLLKSFIGTAIPSLPSEDRINRFFFLFVAVPPYILICALR
jgi:hypothetical protein